MTDPSDCPVWYWFKHDPDLSEKANQKRWGAQSFVRCIVDDFRQPNVGALPLYL